MTHRNALLLPALAVALVAAGAARAQTPASQEVTMGTSRSAAASLPDLGSGANALVSRKEEYQIGRMMLRNLRDENQLLEDPETDEYLQTLGSRIGVEAQDGEHRLTFFTVNDTSINAFAMPGGFIGTNVGLILRSSNESELAGVLAHEIGHVTQRHLVRALQAQSRNSLTTMAAMLGAVLVGALAGGDATAGLLALAQGTAMQQQINFTRMEEHEADRVGINYLADAGFDPNGMADFFGTLMRERGGSPDLIPALLRSHPMDSVRVAEARARIVAMPPQPRRPDTETYELIRERLRVLTSTAGNDLRGHYRQLRTSDPQRLSLQYGAALASLKVREPQEAIELLLPATRRHPGIPLLQSALGQAQLAAGENEGALATFRHALSVSPRNVPLTVRYAETLLALDQPDKAHAALLDLFNNVVPTPEQIRLTALAASAAGDTGDAYFYMAEYHIASGDLMLATTQLDLALAAPSLTEIQRKRFLARRDEIRDFLREQRGARPVQQAPPSG